MSMTSPAPAGTLTDQLARYIASAGSISLPETVVERAKLHLLDTIASMVSGSRLTPGLRAIAYAQTMGGNAHAGIVGTNMATSAAMAALTNGVLAHADETDDTHPASVTHPGRNVAAASLGVGEYLGSSGRDFLNAMVLGYDFCARMPIALDHVALKKSGHYVGPFGGVFGAAAASAALLKLDAQRCRYVLSYAAQQAAGVSSIFRDPEHMQKAIVGGGMPAHNGVVAAMLVAHGCSGAEDPFTGEGDFLTTFSREPNRDELVRGLGRDYEILNSCIKCWSAGGPIQAPLHVLRQLIQQHRFDAGQVEKLTVHIPPNELTIVDNRNMPNVCIQHLLAVMLIDGTVTFESSIDLDRMRDPRVLQVRERIEVMGDPGLTDPLRRWRCAMEIRLSDGRALADRTLAAKGSIENPVTRQEEEEKALDLMGPVLGQERADRLMQAVWRFDELPDVRALRELYAA